MNQFRYAGARNIFVRLKLNNKIRRGALLQITVPLIMWTFFGEYRYQKSPSFANTRSRQQDLVIYIHWLWLWVRYHLTLKMKLHYSVFYVTWHDMISFTDARKKRLESLPRRTKSLPLWSPSQRTSWASSRKRRKKRKRREKRAPTGKVKARRTSLTKWRVKGKKKMILRIYSLYT